MANPKRAANRKASFHVGSSGSPFHTEYQASTQKAGRNEVYTGGPGSAARRTSMDTSNTPRVAAKGSAPKGMKTYNEE